MFFLLDSNCYAISGFLNMVKLWNHNVMDSTHKIRNACIFASSGFGMV